MKISAQDILPKNSAQLCPTKNSFLANFWNFDKIFWMLVFKVSSTCKTIFKITIMTLILPQLIWSWCPWLQYLETFLSFLCTRRARSSRLEEVFIKKVLKNSAHYTRKHLHRGLFCYKAARWRTATTLMQNLVQVLSCEFWEIFKNICFAHACKSLPLKSKIFTGVLHKVLGFYYKRNRQFFYYKGTLSWKFLNV